MFTKAQQFVMLVQTDLLIYALQQGPPPAGFRERSRAWAGMFLNDAFSIAPQIPEEVQAGEAAADFFEFCMRTELSEEEISERFGWLRKLLNSRPPAGP
jgi:hypothetical protein